jgi:predicted nucleotidyltransferase component of viral defense system
MSEKYYTNNLYPFQDLVLKLIMKVDNTFYLTGGTALGRHYLKHRYSDDVDTNIERNYAGIYTDGINKNRM